MSDVIFDCKGENKVQKSIFNRITSVFLLLLVLCGFVACSKTDQVLFADNKYVYQGEPLKICDGVVIEDAYLSFTEISEKEYNQAENKNNLLRNRRNNACFRIDLMFKFDGYDEVHPTCFPVGNHPDMADYYFMSMSFELDGKEIELNYEWWRFIRNYDTSDRCAIKIVISVNAMPFDSSEENNERIVYIELVSVNINGEPR